MASEKELLSDIVAKVVEIHGKAGSLKGKSAIEVIKVLLGVLPDVIKAVEQLDGPLSSADKKELAIEACLKWANIKALPDSMDRQLLSLIIDFVIALLNKWLGKDWIKKVVGVVSKVWTIIKKLFN